MAFGAEWRQPEAARSSTPVERVDASASAPEPTIPRRAVERLRHRADFVAAASGLKVPSQCFVLQARPRGDLGPPRLGFTVSKKVGGAVERNRVRRRLREVMRLSAACALKPGYDYVLVGRRAALAAPFDDLTAGVAAALRRISDGRAKGRGAGTSQRPGGNPEGGGRDKQ